MTDRYEKIRKALTMGPTPGPWEQDGDGVSAYDEDVAVAVSCPSDAEAAFIAACDPDTIRELLSERDALAAALEAAREDAERYRWLRCEAARHKAGDDPGALRVSVTYNPKRSDGNGFTGMLVTPMGDDFDAAIDQARGKGGCEEGVKS